MSRVDDALTRANSERPLPSAAEPVAPAPDFGALLHAEEAAQLWPTERHDAAPAAEPPRIISDAPRAPEEPVAATAPQAPSGFGKLQRVMSAKLVLNAELEPNSVEQYRRLAARLHLDQVQRGTKLVMVTSGLVGEGKTLTATNLALTLSESYRKRVLLVDGDLRRPGIHDMFGIPNFSGLSDAIRSSEERKVPVIRLTEHLSVLTAGRPDSDPMGVLASDRMRRVLADAAAAFDWVIIDTPPVALLSDAHLLGSLVDTVVLVVRAGVTPLEAIRTATVAVGRDRIMGVVLNAAEAGHGNPYRYYGRPKTETETVGIAQ
jgi:protein-tyrosine kinase